MGCFANCFGDSKPRCYRRHRKPPCPTTTTTAPSLFQLVQQRESVEVLHITDLAEKETTEEKIDPQPESKDEPRSEEKLNVSSGRKKVTFDLNVKVYEDELPIDVDLEKTTSSAEERESRERKETQAATESHSDSSSCSSSLFSYPPNHRYQNCRDSDDEFDGILSDHSDFDDDDNNDNDDEDDDNDEDDDVGQQESSGSLFSLSIESRKHKFLAETDDHKEVNSPIPTKNNSTENELNVLNPVENLTQWKMVKSRSKLASKNQAKENFDFDPKPIAFTSACSEEDRFGFGPKKEKTKKEIAVDTSLSSWLVGSETSNNNSPVSVGKCSPKDFEDRPILGALTVEEIRLLSAASSPRKSPIRSPEDTPIIGSVGSYWRHTGQGGGCESGSLREGSPTSRNRFREDTKVIWDATPFEMRLEKALKEQCLSTYS